MQIGEFQVLGELGRGAMAVVYHARSMRTGVDVALKLLAPEKNLRQRERFRREAEALMILNHPNIVGVHGFGEFNGSLYMAMELIPGEGLDERIERLGPLPVGYAVELFTPLAKALGHAHERRILHRDLKPANVLISATGKPYLADFGLAKDADSQGADLTMEGALVGTPDFWSPEQARADNANVGPATDIYGLGATLYAALTGEPPIRGRSLPELVIAIQDKVPPAPHKRRPNVPRSLSAVCMRCLAKKPEQRFASGNALAKALGESLRARSNTRVSRRGLALQLALGVGVTVGAAVWITRGEAAPAEQTLEPPAPPPKQPPPPLSETASREQLLERGSLAIDEEDALAARDAYSAVLQRDPDDPVALIGMGEAALLRDDLHEGLDFLNRGLAALPRDARALGSRGIAYAKLERWDEARSDFELALSLEPKSPRCHRNMGVLCLSTGEHEAALGHFTHAIELYPEDEPAKSSSLINRAITYAERGEFAKAEPDVRAALALDPEISGAHYLLGICDFQAGRWASAAVNFEAALEELSAADPRYPIAQKQLDEARAKLGR